MRPNRTAPASKIAAPAARARTLPLRAGGALVRFVASRPLPVLAAVATLGLGGAVGWNVLTQQTSRHPAPLFGAKTATRAELTRAEPARPEPARVEPPRRFEAASAPAAAPTPVPAPRSETRLAPAPPADPQRTSSTDPIGAMIRTGEMPPRPPSEIRPAGDNQRVQSVQKALAKLGYGPLKPDGVMGNTTRQALERFERDRNLPVTGGVAGRTLRQLATLSGVQIE
jgi:hypothetical protein